jgi:small GTP-binding protein
MEFASSSVYAPKKTKFVTFDEEHFKQFVVKDYVSPGSSGIKGDQCMIDLLDTAGQEEYSSMRDSYMRCSDGFVLMYSITDPSTLEELKGIHDQILRSTDRDDVPCVVIGSKCDMEEDRLITQESGKQFAQKIHAPFYECSSKNGLRIDEPFHHLCELLGKETARITVMGGGGVGKSCLCMRFIQGIYVDLYDPTIEDNFRKMITLKKSRPNS